MKDEERHLNVHKFFFQKDSFIQKLQPALRFCSESYQHPQGYDHYEHFTSTLSENSINNTLRAKTIMNISPALRAKTP